MKEKRLFLLTELALIVVTGVVIVITGAYVDPLLPLGALLRKSILSLLIIAGLLALVFQILHYYYLQLNRQIGSMEGLHEALLKLNSDLKMEYRCNETLTILMDFYQGEKGVLAVTDDRIKGYVSTDVFSIQRATPHRIPSAHYRYNTFSPGRITPAYQETIEKLIAEHQFSIYPSIMIVPFSNEKNTIALAIVGTYLTDKKFFSNLKSMVKIFVEHAVASFENALMHEEVNKASITDPLTALYNRRYFQVRVKEKFSEAQRVGFPVSLMISDLDDFKHYVYTYGHPRGDVVLTKLGGVVKKALRETDIVCRFGGDEFAYLLPYTTSLEARTVAERVKKEVAACPCMGSGPGESVHLTMSMGIANYPEHGENEEEVLRNADLALFQAKEKGKDCIYIYQTEASHEPGE